MQGLLAVFRTAAVGHQPKRSRNDLTAVALSRVQGREHVVLAGLVGGKADEGQRPQQQAVGWLHDSFRTGRALPSLARP